MSVFCPDPTNSIATHRNVGQEGTLTPEGGEPEHMNDHRPRAGTWSSVAKVMLLWILLFVIAKPLLNFQWPPHQWSGSFLRWASYAAADIGFMLPFALFAAGVVLTRKLGYSPRVFRAAAAAGITLSVVAYVMAAWVAPVIDDRDLASAGAEMGDARRFGPATPVGLTRNLRFVEANPPDEYHMAMSTPHRHPPNVLRWLLHLPIAMSVFGLINVLLGVLSAELTADLRRGRRRTTRLAIGVIGGLAFFACLTVADPATPFLDDGTMRSGVAGAWVPLALPAAQALLLFYLLQRRRYG